VIPLTLTWYHSSGFLETTLFFPLFPGLIAQLLITGGHGGTTTQEMLAPIVGATVNLFAYTLLILGASKLFRRFIPK
jgi:uncharacterized membrane protein YeaQ/YmgE (transglycosylase-associated protein family)